MNGQLYDDMLLSKSIIKALHSNADPEQFTAWSSLFCSRIARLECSALDCLLMDDAQWRSCTLSNTDRTDTRQQWESLDYNLSTTLLACFDPASKHFQLLSTRLKRQGGWSSGRDVWHALTDAASPTSGPRKQDPPS